MPSKLVEAALAKAEADRNDRRGDGRSDRSQGRVSKGSRAKRGRGDAAKIEVKDVDREVRS